MSRWQYRLATISFVIFCILWITYDSPWMINFDENISDLLYGNYFLALFHYLGETKWIITITSLLFIIIWIRFQNYRLMVFIILTVAAGYNLNQFLKHVIERPRPEIIDQLSTFSFPSGHAMVGLLYLLTIAYVLKELVIAKRASPAVWIIAIIFIMLIGLSRVAEGRHYASDVLAGWMMGYSWFFLCVKWYERTFSFKGLKRKN